MTPRLYDPGDLAQFDCLEIAAFDSNRNNIDDITQDEADRHGYRVTWCVFLHLIAGHITDLADGFATRAEAVAFAQAVEPLLPNFNKDWRVR